MDGYHSGRVVGQNNIIFVMSEMKYSLIQKYFIDSFQDGCPQNPGGSIRY